MPQRPHHGSDEEELHLRVLAATLALGEGVGAFCILGSAPDRLLAAVASTASELTLVAPPRQGLEDELESRHPAAVIQTESLDDLEEQHGLLVWDLPEEDPLDHLEEALDRVAPGAPLWISLPRERGRDQKLQRLLQASARGPLRPIPGAPWSLLALEGVRAGRRGAGSEILARDPLPMTAVVYSPGIRELLEATLCDLFLRQIHPPATVMIIDDSIEGEAPIPDDLFELPLPPEAEVLLMRPGGIGRIAALNDALGGVQQPFVAFIDEPARLAAGWSATLGLGLEAGSDRSVCVAGWSELSSRGLPGPALSPPGGLDCGAARALADADGTPPLSSMLFRSDRLRAVDGFDPEAGSAADLDLLLRLAERGEIGRVEVPLAGVLDSERPDDEDLAAVWEEWRGRNSLARRARLFLELEREEREDAARRWSDGLPGS